MKKRSALDRTPAERKMSFTRPAGGGASHKRDAFFQVTEGINDRACHWGKEH